MKNEDKKYPKTRYIWFFGRRLIFRDGKFHGWYNHRVDTVV